MKPKSTGIFLLTQIAAVAATNDTKSLKKYITKAKVKRIPFSKMYECLLQNYLFAGYPSALISLKILKEFYPAKILPGSEDMNLYHFKEIGKLNCKKVYGDKFEKLISNIKKFSPELSEWLVLEGYGKVMSRKGLSFKEHELCVVSVLTVLKFEDQLYSHINGAIRAKATLNEIESVITKLDEISKRKFSTFGLKVLSRYKKEKGMS